MSVKSWIRRKLALPASAPRADTAVQLTTEVIDRSRSLRQQLEPFKLRNDPFASIVKAHMLADDYERSQSERTRLGPK